MNIDEILAKSSYVCTNGHIGHNIRCIHAIMHIFACAYMFILYVMRTSRQLLVFFYALTYF